MSSLNVSNSVDLQKKTSLYSSTATLKKALWVLLLLPIYQSIEQMRLKDIVDLASSLKLQFLISTLTSHCQVGPDQNSPRPAAVFPIIVFNSGDSSEVGRR
jgi:hypothetical protein